MAKPHKRNSPIRIVDQLHLGDGIDPRLDKFGDGITSHRTTSPHTGQLCKQVGEAIYSGLLESTDDTLRDLIVLQVIPAPHAGRLLVTLQPGITAGPIDIATILQKLEQQTARLRQTVAEEIHRRKVPELVFQVARVEAC